MKSKMTQIVSSSNYINNNLGNLGISSDKILKRTDSSYYLSDGSKKSKGSSEGNWQAFKEWVGNLFKSNKDNQNNINNKSSKTKNNIKEKNSKKDSKKNNNLNVVDHAQNLKELLFEENYNIQYNDHTNNLKSGIKDKNVNHNVKSHNLKLDSINKINCILKAKKNIAKALATELNMFAEYLILFRDKSENLYNSLPEGRDKLQLKTKIDKLNQDITNMLIFHNEEIMPICTTCVEGLIYMLKIEQDINDEKDNVQKQKKCEAVDEIALALLSYAKDYEDIEAKYIAFAQSLSSDAEDLLSVWEMFANQVQLSKEYRDAFQDKSDSETILNNILHDLEN